MRMRSIALPSAFTLVFKTATVNVAVMVANALGMIVCARVLGAESRGILAAWMIWPPVLSAVLAIGMNSSFIYFSKHEASLNARYTSALIAAAGLMSVMGACLMWEAAPIFYRLQIEHTPALRTCLAAFAFAMTLFSLLSGISQTTHNLSLYNLTRLVPPAIYLILSIFLSLFLKLDTLDFLVIYVGGYLVAGFVLAYSTLSQLGSNFLLDFSIFRKLAAHGLKFWCLDVMAVLSAQVDKMFLVAFLAPRVVGIYAVAYGLSRILTQLQLAIATVLFPRTAGKDLRLVSEQVSLAFRISFVGSALLGGWAVAVGKYAIILMYGHQYAEAAPIFAILIIESIVSGGGWILSQTFNAVGRTELIVMRQIASLTVTCLVMYLLTPIWHAGGVAISLLAGSLIRFVMTVNAYPLFLKIAAPRLVLNGQDLNYLLSRFKQK
jgi:O-antigen/teichoic acid export membrane protein